MVRASAAVNLRDVPRAIGELRDMRNVMVMRSTLHQPGFRAGCRRARNKSSICSGARRERTFVRVSTFCTRRPGRLSNRSLTAISNIRSGPLFEERSACPDVGPHWQDMPKPIGSESNFPASNRWAKRVSPSFCYEKTEADLGAERKGSALCRSRN